MKEKITVEKQRQILAKNINDLLKSKGKTQTDMAHELGIAPTTVSSWLNCVRYPRIDKIQKMADYFGVYRSEITEEKRENEKVFNTSDYPYYENGSLIKEGVLEVPDMIMGKNAGRKDIFLMSKNDDSMNNVIPRGTIVAVKRVDLNQIENGDMVSYCHEGRYYIKRYYRNDNQIILRPDSSRFDFTELVTTLDNTDIEICGKVVSYFVSVG